MTFTVVSETIPPHYAAVIHRLADEGVPLAAIARSLTIPSEQVREELHNGISNGQVIEMPREDWAPGSRRADRGQPADNIIHNEERLRFLCHRTFKTTNLQSAMLAALLRRDECTKQHLHDVIEHNRLDGNKEPTDPKMVDVMLCHVRKKLKPFGILVKTNWGRGYMIETDGRDLAVQHIEARDNADHQVKEAA